MKFGSYRGLELWGVLLIPWVLEALGGTQVFSTLWGSLLWGLMMAAAATRVSTIDRRLRRIEAVVLCFGSLLWVLYWFYALRLDLSPPDRSGSPGSASWLIRSHAAFLASAVGVMFVHWIVATLGWTQSRLLGWSSWSRRKVSFQLPSSESLLRGLRISSTVAFLLWAMGFVLALVAGALSWRRFDSLDWLLDAKVLTSAVLMLIVGWCFQYAHRSLFSQTSWMRSWIFASVFIVFFVVYFWFGGTSGLHEPVSWFLK
jgi:hypothetical protein